MIMKSLIVRLPSRRHKIQLDAQLITAFSSFVIALAHYLSQSGMFVVESFTIAYLSEPPFSLLGQKATLLGYEG